MSAAATGPVRRGRLFAKYAIVLVAFVSGALLASGAIEVYFAYRQTSATLLSLQREKAAGAAVRIEAFIDGIEQQMRWVTQPQLVAPSAALEQRRDDYYRLQRQVEAITELSHLDATGHEQVRVSRLAMDVMRSGIDFSADPRFREARAGRPYFGPVYFRKESEPYMTIALPESGGGVTAAEVNLKFIWDVVSRINIGKAGQVFVVDRDAILIAHPDISRVLRKTSLASLAHVEAALHAADPNRDDAGVGPARDLRGRRVFSAHWRIEPLQWTVFAEQPLEDALLPLRASVERSVLLVLVGVVGAVVVSLLLARRMVRPIQALETGAARIGSGDLAHRIEVNTGDEVEALADRFNQMTGQLRDSYATLEQRVEERTRDLAEALAQQTATAEILRVISGSRTDVQPVFDAIVRNAVVLCQALFGAVFRFDGERIHFVAHHNFTPTVLDLVSQVYPMVPNPGQATGRAILTGELVHLHDALADSEYYREMAVRGGWRSILAVPMSHEGRAVGVIWVARAFAGPFPDDQITLLRTFADQAVIAIENVRLFTELQQRTEQLTRSVDQLTALGEVGRAVSSTLDLEAVLTTIVSRAVELSGLDGGVVFEYDEATAEFVQRAAAEQGGTLAPARRGTRIRKGEGILGQTAITLEPVQVADITVAGAYESRLREALIASGVRALLAVPMVRERRVIGSIVVSRKRPGDFAADTVELLRTFATQSALAIQNARLYSALQQKSRELEIASRHKSEFLASMSHELRTPLNAVIGFSEVLLERMFGELNEKQEEYLHDILGSGRHLLSLINDILDLAKIEAGRMELEASNFNLPQAIDNAVTLVRERASRRGLTLEKRVDERLGDIRGDERKVKQVLLNLLSNAVKFTPEGGRIEVRARPVDGAIEVAVSDTGIGIAPEHHEAVFEEFRQVGEGYAKKQEGTGLGLTLTRKFVELHGGKIWVTSRLGEGATFTFTLPVESWPAN